MKKYKCFSVCEIDADNFSTSSYFGDGEGFPTVGYDIESESVEDAEKKMKEIWESEDKVENCIREDVEGLTPKLLELMGETETTWHIFWHRKNFSKAYMNIHFEKSYSKLHLKKVICKSLCS